MKLKQLSRHAFYLEGQPNIGIIKEGDSAILIDSGANENTAVRILKTLEKEGLFPLAILNTHSHADHCGGNRCIKERTGALVYAPRTEASIIQSPFLEPLYLFSGANPLEELQAGTAEASEVDYVISDSETSLVIDTLPLNIVRLPGHSPNQVGIEVDNILFSADALFSADLLDYYKIPFHSDMLRQKQTLNRLALAPYEVYVPAHSPPGKDLAAAARYNLEVIEGVEQFLLRTLVRRKTTEEVMKELCLQYRIQVNKVLNSYLIYTVTQAFLGSLREQGAIDVEVRDNLPCWEKTALS